MSRFSDDYEEDFPGQSAFWWANYERALKGKRGRKLLADMREALLALPEHKLIEGALCTVGATAEAEAERAREAANPSPFGPSHYPGELEEAVDVQGEGVCAMGAYLWHEKVKAGMDPAEAFAALPRLLDSQVDAYETARAGQQAGVALTLAWSLASRNDETYGHMTPEERHAAFIAWIDEQLAVSA